MTINEVIEYLEQHGFIADEVKDMCIGALVQIEQYVPLGTVEELKEAKKLLEKLEELKFANEQPKTDWIPCEERLPDNAGMFLATYVYEGAKIVEIMFFDGKNYYYPDDMLGISKKFIEVIAWQPLPQPYKKEGAE